MLSADPTWGGLLRGILVLGALWWAWAAYAWLTNTLNPEEGIVRIAMFVVMAAMLVAALAVPGGVRRPRRHLRSRLSHRADDAPRVVRPCGARRSRPARRSAADDAVVDDQRRPDPDGRLSRRRQANRALDHRTGDRLPRRGRGPGTGLASVARPFRRAARADRDHRHRRVDRRPRSRRHGDPALGRRHRSGRGRDDHRGRALVDVLRLGRDRRRAATPAGDRRCSRRPSPATPTATCTSPWSPGSSCSRRA